MQFFRRTVVTSVLFVAFAAHISVAQELQEPLDFSFLGSQVTTEPRPVVLPYRNAIQAALSCSVAVSLIYALEQIGDNELAPCCQMILDYCPRAHEDFYGGHDLCYFFNERCAGKDFNADGASDFTELPCD